MPPKAAPEKNTKGGTILFFAAPGGDATVIEGMATVIEGGLKGKSSGPGHDATVIEGRQLSRRQLAREDCIHFHSETSEIRKFAFGFHSELIDTMPNGGK